MDDREEALLRKEQVGSPVERGSGPTERIIKTGVGRDMGKDDGKEYCQVSEQKPSSNRVYDGAGIAQ